MKRWIGLPLCMALFLSVMAGCTPAAETPADVLVTEENPVADPPTATAEPIEEPDPTDTPEPTSMPEATDTPVPAETEEPEPFAGFELADVGFATPESVLYDPEADVYLVSNINGGASSEDDNGFISRISPDGEVLELKWIDGADDDVELDAPKGMALVGDRLYIADINDVRVFDRTTGAPVETIPFPNAKFLNDMAPGIYVSDSGAGTVYVFGETGAMGDFAVNGVNGVDYLDSQFYATSGTQIVKTTADGPEVVFELPAGGLDGLVMLDAENALISSWSGEAIYYANADGTVEVLYEGAGMADIGYDSLRHRILIPRFNDNAIAVYPLADLVPLP